MVLRRPLETGLYPGDTIVDEMKVVPQTGLCVFPKRLFEVF